MGSYSQLKIGSYSLAWKYHVPSFVVFLFDDNDFYQELDPEDDGDDECKPCVREIGWRTTVASALQRVNRSGYGRSFFAMIFDTLRSDLEDRYEESVKDRIGQTLELEDREEIEAEIDRRYLAHLGGFPRTSSSDVATDFVKFIEAATAATGERGVEGRQSSFRAVDGKEYVLRPEKYELNDEVLTRPESLETFLYSHELDFPPWVVMAASMMEFDDGLDRPEVFFLMMFWVLLEVSSPNAIVCLDLADLDFTEQDVRELPQRMRFDLTRKVSLYNSAFRVLLENEQAVREDYTKLECAKSLEHSRLITDANEKGRALEDIVEMLFRLERGLVLQDKRVVTGDEEIDLLYRNNVDRPFWLSFQSPLVFVECKNWSKNVGAVEIRNFEGKLRNHAGAKIGVMVAGSGFTREVDNALRRQSRENYHITLITLDEILEFCRSDRSFHDWVEEKMATVH
jgi:hypothetical protein